MALVDQVTSRYPASRLVQLTRQGSQSSTTVDTTVLGLAADDVEADFPIVCAVEYDNADPRHVAVAVEGVIAKLAIRTEAAGDFANALHDRYLKRLAALAKVTGRDRVTPRTKSVLTPTPERDGTETVRPDTDRPNFDDLVPTVR